jgi:hypothetical protein
VHRRPASAKPPPKLVYDAMQVSIRSMFSILSMVPHIFFHYPYLASMKLYTLENPGTRVPWWCLEGKMRTGILSYRNRITRYHTSRVKMKEDDHLSRCSESSVKDFERSISATGDWSGRSGVVVMSSRIVEKVRGQTISWRKMPSTQPSPSAAAAGSGCRRS